MNTISFEMQDLDVSGIKESDLKPKFRLNEPGEYALNIEGAELNPKKFDGSQMENKTDANGNVFQPFQVNYTADVNGQVYTISDLFYMPLTGSLWYKKDESSKPTLVFATKLKSLVAAITGEEVTLANLSDMLKSVGGLLSAGGTVHAKVVKKSKEEITKGDDGLYRCTLVNGQLLEDLEGDVVEADSFKGVTEQYKIIKGQSFKSGVEIKSYFIPKAD